MISKLDQSRLLTQRNVALYVPNLPVNPFCRRKTNIFDNVVYMMEKYADNLEDLVSERTAQLVEEKKKTDALLDRILPR